MTKYLIEFEKFRPEDDQDLFKAVDAFTRENFAAVEFLKPGRDKKGDFLQAQNYVGIIQTKSGDSLEILPKIHDNDNSSNEEAIENSKKILLTMLKTLKNHPFKNINIANLKSLNLPLLEIFILMFLDEVSKLIKIGIKSDYVELEDNLKFLKGKLKISEQIRKNIVHKERFYICYQEFSIDMAENRLIKSALEFLYKRSKSSKNQRLIREYLFIFDEISSSSDINADFSRLKLNRQTKHYEQALLWSKIFLQNKSFGPYRGNDLAIALLFDMNVLFESYVGNFVKKKFPGTALQHSEKHLIENPRSFRLRPDIFLEGKFIADTKWKIVKSRDDISQADLYQLYAYGKKYEYGRLYLVYPRISGVDQKAMKFKYENNMWLNVLYFDLEKDEIARKITSLKYF
ncbi:McrC family protein [Campylobacter concisus]|uniref:Putative McrBC 5-methylcytosine restriction system component McrC n=1 Tax=Campylobacter concisus TaxID=199 RepID=A0A0M4TMB6_9BACT|nr:McrC family protein [Campylobacter concisus]ALF47706.1 putative McrBC 5-methylcytosine restriction system component McrC [Campylobacter concisus]